MWHPINVSSLGLCELVKLHRVSVCLAFLAWPACLPSNRTSTPLSPPKPKDSAATALPTLAPGRNSSQVASGQSQGQGQPPAGSHQLSVSPAHSSTGSSPHTLRRGKWPPLLCALRGCAQRLGRASQGGCQTSQQTGLCLFPETAGRKVSH